MDIGFEEYLAKPDATVLASPEFYIQVPALQSGAELGYFKQAFGIESVATLTLAPSPVDGQRSNESGRYPELVVR